MRNIHCHLRHFGAIHFMQNTLSSFGGYAICGVVQDTQYMLTSFPGVVNGIKDSNLYVPKILLSKL